MERDEDVFSFLLCFFFLCFSLCCFCSFADTSPQLDQTQVPILASLSSYLPHSFAGAQWNSTIRPNRCAWKGVTCSSSSTSLVEGLDLSGVGFSATADFFENLCRLDSLRWLDLSRNTFTTIPESFSDCRGLSGLQRLNMSSNGLTGRLQNFSSFGSLQMLDLSRNNLTGGIGLQLDDLAQLQSLNLSFNSFNESIPSLRKSRGLKELVLSYNRLAGGIPTEISLHRNLTILDLSWNNISGRIPDELGELAMLEILLLSGNQLYGQIPNNLSMIRNLYRFAANTNNFSGAIPSALARHVKNLDLSYNQLSGSIPSGFLTSPTLEFLDLTGNRLEGAIPAVGSSPSLFRLRLGWNSLTGSIPQTIGNLSGLEYLELDGNNLSSQIPPQIGNIKNLTLLNLASNRLEGELPKELGDLQKLVVLQLQSNTFTGMIPDQVFKLTNLWKLNLSRNSFSGVVSSEIVNLNKLSFLDLHGNEFEGSIPHTIGNLTALIDLELGDNRLNGTIPIMPLNLRMVLNLSHNLLSGPLPSNLGDLTQLEILDLSNNNFTGQVPNSFADMSSLTLLDLSNNDGLSGTLPDKLTKFATVITSGTEIRNSTQNTVSRKKKNSVWIIVVATVGALFGLSFIVIVLVLMFPRRFYRVKDEQAQSEESTPQIVSGHLITANDFHRSGIDFSKVMEMVCDPRNIQLKTRFSTYYKVVMPNGASYVVKKLNWPGKVFQVESHAKIGQAMEALGMTRSSNIMVPLAYMSTEDDAYLFYGDVYKGTVFDFLHKDSDNVLDWSSRYAIMLGVAQGLTFLHGCTQPITLLDLTTKSIKLKSHKEPQIGDIELLRVIDATKSTGSLSAVAGSVGYVPPEYAYTMKVTMAGNVYSFGVILLELLTGKQPVNNGLELARWALNFSTKPAERELMLDSRISKTSLAVRSQMLSVLKVAIACVSLSPGGRPKMLHALRMIRNAK